MNNDGKAPVHLAAEGGHAEALRALAGARVDLDQRRLGDGYAALHIAVENGDGNSVRALLECGADVEVRNYRGETPLQLAFLCQRQDLVRPGFPVCSRVYWNLAHVSNRLFGWHLLCRWICAWTTERIPSR